MKALIFDSTSEDLLVMLISGEKTDYIISSGDKRSHNSKILELADELLERNNLTVSDIEYVSSVTGPAFWRCPRQYSCWFRRCWLWH